jgi:hypothetical protein
MADLAVGAGFNVVFQGSRPPEKSESCPQGYLLLRKAQGPAMSITHGRDEVQAEIPDSKYSGL